MNILAHRGLWNSIEEKNTMTALKRAIDEGFGIETDLRDYRGELVISHDIASEESPKAEELFEYYAKTGSDVFLALNIKADGIQNLLVELLGRYGIFNYAVFDMSVPELVVYNNRKIVFFSRQSEIEREIVCYNDASGVWMDEWKERWISKEVVGLHIKSGKKVGVISPEIHGREYIRLWEELRGIESNDLMLCTDLAHKARDYFNA